MSCNNTCCSGPYCQPLAHVGPNGCLYANDSQADDNESVWETDSESEEEEPNFLSRLSAEIARRADQYSEVWVDVGSAEGKEAEPEKPELFEAPIPLGECPICYENLKMIDFTVTKCGHTFHSSCVFKAMEQNVDCPMCRCQLLEIQEEDEDEDQEDQDQYQDQEDEDQEDEDQEDEDEDGDEPKVTLEQLYTKLQNMGYTPLDILAYVVENGNLKRQDEARNTSEFVDELGDKIWGVVFGNITMAHVDQRTYAQVAAAAQPVVQLKDLERRLLTNRPQEAV